VSEQPTQLAPPATNGTQPIVLPLDMQPAQRVLTNLHELSDAELLSILLWGGTRQTEINAAYSLLQKVNGDLMMLRRHSTQELRAMGLDDRTIAKLRALIEMENRLAVPTYQDIEAITSPNHAAKMMMVRLRGRDKEEIVVMSLDGALHILGIDTVALGQPNTVTARWADIFAPPVRYHATAVIVFHNHPAGPPEPSAADIAMTTDLIAVGKIMQIKVEDHVVIGGGRFISIRERGLVDFK
jgi:DNA repair protein RadC